MQLHIIWMRYGCLDTGKRDTGIGNWWQQSSSIHSYQPERPIKQFPHI